MDKFRSRNFCLVLYPEDETHVEAVAKLSTGYKYLAVLHNRDVYDSDDTDDMALVGTPKKEHWHIVLKFPQARWNCAVSKELGVSENYIQKCVSLDAYLIYMLHADLPHKAQYDKSEAFGTMHNELLRALQTVKTPDERALEVIDIIDNMGYCDMRTVIIECAKAGRFSDLRQMGSWVPHIICDHNARIEREVDKENMQARFTYAMLYKGKNGRTYADYQKKVEY